MAKGIASLEGIVDAKNDLEDYLKWVDKNLDTEVDKLAENIYVAALKIVPYDTGRLSAGIYARRSKAKGKRGIVVGAVAKNKKNYNYALIQHENEEYFHDYPREAKFIEKPFDDELEKFYERMRDTL